jgi:transaldolase/glucose-6-phosphate isomerase
MANNPSRTTAGNPVAELRQYGQSVWLDFLRRNLVESGELGRLIAEDGLAGVTSNPAIFQKAIEGNADYAAPIAQIAKHGAPSPRQVFERLAVADVRAAADVLAPTYWDSRGADGFVSLEVAPDLARDTQGSIEEARRLWSAVDRANVMIKVPATAEGLPAVFALLGEGINVNVTLLFARSVYEKVAAGYLAALEQRLRSGERIDNVASVASFFVSRIDTAVDERIHSKLGELQGSARAALAALAGKVAIANAKLAYQSYLRIFSGPRWHALRAAGARPQRLLWASTGTKNPSYSDVLYVDELIGRDTVNTMPPETLAAYRHHGQPRPSLESDLDEAEQVLAGLARAGISLDEVTEALVVDGVQKFVEPYERLLTSIARRLHEPAH